MSMHKLPLSRLEEEGLKAHGLSIETPSQLSDAFRQGIAWALSHQAEQQPVAEVLWPDEHGRRGGFSQIGHYDDPRLPMGAKLYAAPIAQTAQETNKI